MKKYYQWLLILAAFFLVACQADPPQSDSIPASTVAETAAPAQEEATNAPISVSPEVTSTIPQPTAEVIDSLRAPEEDDSEGDQVSRMALINPPPQLSEREAGVHLTSCPPTIGVGKDEVEGETYYCGIFTVPQNWDEPDGDKLDLSFVIFKASAEDPDPDPIMFLAGGPGQSATISPIAIYDSLRPTRDIIHLDQRGTGLSQRLGLEECLVLARQNGATDSEVDLLQAGLDAVELVDQDAAAINQICWSLFAAQGLDLNQFNTQASTRDVVALIKALDYDSFNLHGISYGTRLAMTIMNELPTFADAPDLRAVVLDSAFPPSVYMLSSLPRSDHDFILQLLDDCHADALCREAYPNLHARLGSLLRKVAQAPISSDDETITLDDVVGALSNVGNTRAGYIPRLIAELEAGNLDTYHALANWEVGTGDPEGVPGLDRQDPVQAFVGDAVKLVGGSDDMSIMFDFVGGMEEVAGQQEPTLALETFISENYTDELRTELLELSSILTAEDFAASTYFSESSMGTAPEDNSVEISPEEQAELDLVIDRKLALIGLAQPLYNTIHCQEDMPFEEVGDVIALANRLDFPQFVDLDRVEAVAGSCENWPVDPAPIAVKDPVISDIPALILQGAYDKATPVYMGQLADEELENSTLVLVPQQGHEVWRNEGGCVGQIAHGFMQNPESDLDLSCLEIREPAWALPNN